MTDEEKAEYDGAGSGTQGGWGAEDEDNARYQHAKKNVENLGYDSNKVFYIFADKHEMNSLINEIGSREQALQ